MKSEVDQSVSARFGNAKDQVKLGEERVTYARK